MGNEASKKLVENQVEHPVLKRARDDESKFSSAFYLAF